MLVDSFEKMCTIIVKLQHLNLFSQNRTQGTVLCVPDTNNRLLSQIEGVGESIEKHSAYNYDNNGNLLMRNTQILSDGTGDNSALSLEATQQVANSVVDKFQFDKGV